MGICSRLSLLPPLPLLPPPLLRDSLPVDAPHARPPTTASTPHGPPLALAPVVRKLALALLLVPSGATRRLRLLLPRLLLMPNSSLRLRSLPSKLLPSLPEDAPHARLPTTASTPPGPPLALAPVVRKPALAPLLALSGATRKLRLLLPRLVLMPNSSLRLRSLPRKLLTSLPEDAPLARLPITASTPPGPPLALAPVVKKLALAPLLVPSGATKMPNLLSSSDQSAISYFLF